MVEPAGLDLEERGACTNTREARAVSALSPWPTSESSVGPAQGGWLGDGGWLPTEGSYRRDEAWGRDLKVGSL